MATVTKGKTFISGETVEPADMHQLVDSATVTNIVDADIGSGAAIALSKLATGALPAAITVASANLVDGTIATADIADAAVTAPKLSGAQTGNAPIYGCRAWVNINGFFTPFAGVGYSRTGTAVTVTRAAHGLSTGSKLAISAATDAGLNTTANTASTEIAVIDASNFTFQTSSSGAASGTLTYARGIRASGNVASVRKNGTGDYTITFITAMPDDQYCVFGTMMATGTTTSANIVYELDAANRTTSSCRIAVGDNQIDQFFEPSFGTCVQIIR